MVRDDGASSVHDVTILPVVSFSTSAYEFSTPFGGAGDCYAERERGHFDIREPGVLDHFTDRIAVDETFHGSRQVAVRATAVAGDERCGPRHDAAAVETTLPHRGSGLRSTQRNSLSARVVADVAQAESDRQNIEADVFKRKRRGLFLDVCRRCAAGEATEALGLVLGNIEHDAGEIKVDDLGPTHSRRRGLR